MHDRVAEIVTQGLSDLGNETVTDEERTRLLAGARGRLERSRRRRSRIAGSGGALLLATAALLVLVLVPVSYRVTVGARLTVAWPAADPSSDRLAVALESLPGVAVTRAEEAGGSWTMHLRYRGVEVAELRRAVDAALFEHLADPGAARTRAMVFRREVGGTLLAKLSPGGITVQGGGLDDARLEQVIADEIERWGARDAEVEITVTPSGRRLFDIRYRDAPADSLSIDIEY